MYKPEAIGQSGVIEERCQEKPVKYALMTNNNTVGTKVTG